MEQHPPNSPQARIEMPEDDIVYNFLAENKMISPKNKPFADEGLALEKLTIEESQFLYKAAVVQLEQETKMKNDLIQKCQNIEYELRYVKDWIHTANVVNKNLSMKNDQQKERITKLEAELYCVKLDCDMMKEDIRKINEISSKYSLKLEEPKEVKTLFCNICMINPINIALLPCGHTCCTVCYPELKGSCHMCRRPTNNFFKIYF